MKKSFNSDFYFMAATVIPVLYVALIVQFPLIDRIVASILKTIDRYLAAIPADVRSRKRWRRKFTNYITFVPLAVFVISALMLTLGTTGEVGSVLALYDQSDSDWMRRSALYAIFFLIGLTVLIPAWTMVAAMIRFFKGSELRMMQSLQQSSQEVPEGELPTSGEEDEKAEQQAREGPPPCGA